MFFFRHVLMGDFHIELILEALHVAMHPKPRVPYQLKCTITPQNQHQQHKWAALVWRGWLTSSLIIWRMLIPPLRNETHSLQRANYQSQLLRSQQEMTSGIHVIRTACQRKSALHQIKCKHQLKSRIVETVQSEMSSELPNKPSVYVKFNLAETIKFYVILFLKYHWTALISLFHCHGRTALGLFGILRFQ